MPGANSNNAPVIAAGASLAALAILQLGTSANPVGRCLRFYRQLSAQETRLTASSSVNKGIDDYSALHREKSVEERNDQYKVRILV
jgi:hypothetical protein